MVLPRFLVVGAGHVAALAHAIFARWAAFFHTFDVHAAFVTLDHFLGFSIRDLLHLLLIHN